jgi:hypothetical protein
MNTNTHTARVMQSLEELHADNQAEIQLQTELAAASVAKIGRMVEKAYFGGPTTAQEDAAWARIRAGEVNREPVAIGDDMRDLFDEANRGLVRWGIAGVIVFGLGWLAGWGF